MSRASLASTPNIMEEPMCIVENTRDGRIGVNKKTLEQLQNLDKEVVVVVIAGPYRTGKSYLMNRLAGHHTGFALGSTVQSKTKGIWVWARPHPKKPNKYLILMDTEGLGDVEKGDGNHDNQLLCLAVLLASTFVYNVTAVINNDSIEKLHFVTELAKHIQMRSDQRKSDDTNFDFYFPDFIYVLRDFALELIIDGKPVTADEYLEHSLTLRSDGASAKGYNKIREAIRKYFKSRKCFTFVSPAAGKKVNRLEEIPDHELDPDFVQQADEFVKHVYEKSPAKQVNGKRITGAMLAQLLEVYVEQIKNGGMPYIENAVDTMSQVQNKQAKEHAIAVYYQKMLDALTMPVIEDDEFSRQHNICLRHAIAAFLSKSIFDDDHKYQMEMNEELQNIYSELVRQNDEICITECNEVLESLYEPIKNKYRQSGYLKNGGFQEYKNDMKELQKKFYKQLGKLGKKKKVPTAFLR